MNSIRLRHGLGGLVLASFLAASVGCSAPAESARASSSESALDGVTASGSLVHGESLAATLAFFGDPQPVTVARMCAYQMPCDATYAPAVTSAPLYFEDGFEIENLTTDPESAREIAGMSGGSLYASGGQLVPMADPVEAGGNGLRALVATASLGWAALGVNVEIMHLQEKIREAATPQEQADLAAEKEAAERHLHDINEALKEIGQHLGGTGVRPTGDGSNFWNAMNERSQKILGVMNKAEVKRGLEYAQNAKNRGGGFGYDRRIDKRRR